jgi:hypothetical protein
MIYLLCGVPASGKSWVAEQLKDVFEYLPHDSMTRTKLVSSCIDLSRLTNKPILVDCPFNERALREILEKHELNVTPIFIVEAPEVIQARYLEREGKLPPMNVLTRATTIMNKVIEWQAYYGTSDEVLRYLRSKVRDT